MWLNLLRPSFSEIWLNSWVYFFQSSRMTRLDKLFEFLSDLNKSYYNHVFDLNGGSLSCKVYDYVLTNTNDSKGNQDLAYELQRGGHCNVG